MQNLNLVNEIFHTRLLYPYDVNISRDFYIVISFLGLIIAFLKEIR